MIRLFKILFLVVLAAVLATIAVANREPASVTLLTPELAELLRFNVSTTQPMFIIVFASIVAGLLIGFIWEWFREARHRQEVSMRQQQVRELKREVIRLRGKVNEGSDDVLALLEDDPLQKAS